LIHTAGKAISRPEGKHHPDHGYIKLKKAFDENWVTDSKQ
jgi:hypothetical protein